MSGIKIVVAKQVIYGDFWQRESRTKCAGGHAGDSGHVQN